VQIATDALQQTAQLLDHLVGGGDERRRHDEAERLGGGFQVDDEFVRGRCLTGTLHRFDDNTRALIHAVHHRLKGSVTKEFISGLPCAAAPTIVVNDQDAVGDDQIIKML
jgi:hypothetical protein